MYTCKLSCGIMLYIFEHLEICPVDHVEYEEEKRGEEEEESVHIVVSATSYNEHIVQVYFKGFIIY